MAEASYILGVIGDPVAHSLSPRLHGAALRARGLAGWYVPLRVPAHDLEAAVRGLWALGFWGANVTIPHKEALCRLVDELTPEARQIGAVNTLYRGPTGWVGANTDAEGFARSLPRGAAPQAAELLGAGGAARAVAVALARRGVRYLAVVGRTLARAQDVAALARSLGVATEAKGWEERHAPGRRIDLLVNATPIGMWPEEGASPVEDFEMMAPQGVVVDLVYRPLRTQLLRRAEQAGLRTVDGLWMLAHQAALSWEYWFGEPGPVDVMRAACLEALAEEARTREEPETGKGERPGAGAPGGGPRQARGCYGT